MDIKATEKVVNEQKTAGKLKKNKNIILISAFGVLTVMLVALVVFINSKSEAPTTQEFQSVVDDRLVEKEMIYRTEEEFAYFQKYLLDGKIFVGTTAESDKGVIFYFANDGKYFGYTTADEHDAGKWSVHSLEDGGYVVIDTLNALNRYKISHNNNNDITLRDDTGKTFVLAEKEEMNTEESAETVEAE